MSDASPLKRIRMNEVNTPLSLDITDSEQSLYPSFPFSPLKLGEQSFRNSDAVFSYAETRAMKGLLGSVNNILKQSAGRKWVYYEWFYSNIDRALLLGENDFESCLQQLFKNLKTRKLTKVQWSMIRRLMGKPRRCSPAFFDEERHSLEEKRKKIRYLHQLKGFEVTDMTRFKGWFENLFSLCMSYASDPMICFLSSLHSF